MNMFNYIDRYVLAAVEPNIRQSLLAPDDPNLGKKMGALPAVFMISYMLTAPLFGLLAERYSRWKLIALGVLLWSLASGASGMAHPISGLATAFTVLLITRCFVGVGEGAYGPIAPTIISDFYPVAIRGRVLSWFYMAIPVGGALGYALGGQVAPAWGWRWAFYVVVPPGVLLSLWAFLMREPERGASESLAAPARRASMKDYSILLQTPSYVWNTLGMTAMTFAVGAFGYWMPAYLECQKVEPIWGIQPVTFFGILTAVAGLTGTMAGGIIGDWLRRWFSGSYFLVSGAGMVLCVPCALLFLASSFPAAWYYLFLTEFFLFFNTGPSNTVLANVTHPSIRATGFALNILVIHALGDVPSPFLVGAIKDQWSLTIGYLAVSGFMLLAGVFWLLGARHLEHDTTLAPTRLL
jgi:MFS family permease